MHGYSARVDLPFRDEQFDHVFLCFVLEHVADPAAGLAALKRILRRSGTITAIEGDHGSWYCYPQTREASRAVQCLVEIQARLGDDALIGRRLYPLLAEAGFHNVRVSPRMVYFRIACTIASSLSWLWSISAVLRTG